MHLVNYNMPKIWIQNSNIIRFKMKNRIKHKSLYTYQSRAQISNSHPQIRYPYHGSQYRNLAVNVSVHAWAVASGLGGYMKDFLGFEDGTSHINNWRIEC